MQRKKLSVAVVGLGYFSRFHLSAWQARPDCAVIGITDIDAARTAQVAAARGLKGFSTTHDLLATDPDIVDMVVPPAAQADLLRLCLKPGRTLICQKPFGRSLAEATEMTRDAEAQQTALIVHENFRFQPWHRAIKSFLDEDRLGQIYGASFTLRPGDGRGPRAYLDRQPSFQTMERFLVQETAVHFIDLFRWHFGEIETVYADLRRLNTAIRGEDAGLLVLNHTGGAQSVFDGNRLSDHVAENPRLTMGEMTVEGEAGVMTLDGSGSLRFRAFGEHAARAVAIEAQIDPDAFGGGCVAALIAHVVDALAGRGQFENTSREYLDVIRACEAAYRSNAEGRRIAL